MSVAALAQGLLGLWLMVDPRARHVDWRGGAALELRGGSAPVFAGEPSEPALRITLSPRAGLVYRARARRRSSSIEYAPQIYTRLSEDYCASTQCARPLQLHQLRARYGGELGRRWSVRGVAGGSAGQLDYSVQSAQLGSAQTADAGTVGSSGQQGALLDETVIWSGGASASAELTGRLSRRHSLSVRPSATVLRLLSDPVRGPLGAALVLEQTSADLSLSHVGVVSRVDTITTTAMGGHADFGPHGAQAYASATTAWRRRLRPRLDSELSGGAFLTVQRSGDARGTPVLPLVDYRLWGCLLPRARLRILGDIRVGTQAYFDPVRGSVLALGGGGVSIHFVIPPDLTAGLMAGFYTPASVADDADVAEAATAASARTTLSVRTPVIYRIDRHRALEAGTIVTARGPHLGVPTSGGRLPQTEWWLYVAFRIDYSTVRGPP